MILTIQAAHFFRSHHDDDDIDVEQIWDFFLLQRSGAIPIVIITNTKLELPKK